MSFSSALMLMIEASVLGWRLPSVSLFARSAPSYSGFASSSCPMSFSRKPMLLIEVNVPGWRSPSLSLHACSTSTNSGFAFEISSWTI